MRSLYLSLILFIALLPLAGCDDAGVQPVFDTPMYFKGYTYTSFAADGFAQGSALAAVTDLRAQTASTWIALTVSEFQTAPQTYDIAPNYTGVNPVTGGAWYATSSIEDLRTAIRDARSAGMRVLLKPHVDCYAGLWRGLIQPDAEGRWFAAYEVMMMKYAELAQAEHCEMLCIGTELATATEPQFTPQWKALIARIRTVYGGMLTYSANWAGLWGPPEFEQVAFWDALDYIGVSAYFPLASSPLEPLPTQAAAEARLHAHGQRLSALAVHWGKQVILTEVGCQSAKGALANPADHTCGQTDAAVADNAAQALYYTTVLNYFGSRPWCAGMFFWNWESVRSSREATDYTCRNKPAALVLRRFYAGEPPALFAQGQ